MTEDVGERVMSRISTVCVEHIQCNTCAKQTKSECEGIIELGNTYKIYDMFALPKVESKHATSVRLVVVVCGVSCHVKSFNSRIELSSTKIPYDETNSF